MRKISVTQVQPVQHYLDRADYNKNKGGIYRTCPEDLDNPEDLNRELATCFLFLAAASSGCHTQYKLKNTPRGER